MAHLKEQHSQLFPPSRSIIRTLEEEQPDEIDAQQTATKEVKRRRPTMEELGRRNWWKRRISGTVTTTSEWHMAKAEKAKVEQLERKMVRISHKSSIADRHDKEVNLDELVFTMTTATAQRKDGTESPQLEVNAVQFRARI